MEAEIRAVTEWKPLIKHVLDSKMEEFVLMGYSQATNENIWKCLEEKVWKKNQKKRLYEVVQDVFHLQSNTYMSYLTINAYQNDDDLMASIAALTGKNLDG